MRNVPETIAKIIAIFFGKKRCCNAKNTEMIKMKKNKKAKKL